MFKLNIYDSSAIAKSRKEEKRAGVANWSVSRTTGLSIQFIE